MGTEEDRQLFWLVYTSHATTRFDDDRLASLLGQSRPANRRRGITGLLLYREQRFLQVLEGPRDQVWDLVSTIISDPRHHDVQVVLDEPVSERRFADWSMGFRPWSAPTGDLPDGFRETFDDLAIVRRPEETVQAVRELIEWFRYRDDLADALDH